MPGWSPPKSARRVSPPPAASSASAAATTEVPEPPFGDQRARSTGNPPSEGRRQGARRQAEHEGGRAGGETDEQPLCTVPRAFTGRQRNYARRLLSWR